jgi:hypothetical protein
LEIGYDNPKAEKHFFLDASLGRDLTIVFEFTNADFDITVQSPSGESYNKKNLDSEFWCDAEYLFCQFGLAEAEVRTCHHSQISGLRVSIISHYNNYFSLANGQ